MAGIYLPNRQRASTTTEKLTSRTEHVEGEEAVDTGEVATEAKPPEIAGKRRGVGFTSESARAARQLRAEKDAARHAEAERERTLSHLTSRQRMGLALAELTQQDMRDVVQALLLEAKSGDTKAVHAIARLLDQSFGRSGEEKLADDRPFVDKTFDEMTPQERSLYRQELLKRIRENEQAAGDDTDPRGVPPDDIT